MSVILTFQRPSASEARVVRTPLRGRLLYVTDVRELLGNGKSAWWVKRHFAPDSRFKIGRDCVWYESDARDWIDTQRVRK